MNALIFNRSALLIGVREFEQNENCSMAYKTWQSFVLTEIGSFLPDQLAIQTKEVLGSVRVGN